MEPGAAEEGSGLRIRVEGGWTRVESGVGSQIEGVAKEDDLLVDDDSGSVVDDGDDGVSDDGGGPHNRDDGVGDDGGAVVD